MNDPSMSKVDAPPPYAPPQYGFGPPGQQSSYPPHHQLPPEYGAPPPGYGTQQQPPPGMYGYPTQPPPATVMVPATNIVSGATRTVIINTGNCPVCGVGVLRDELTCFGITMAILLFPIGLLCLLITQKRCTNCGSTF